MPMHTMLSAWCRATLLLSVAAAELSANLDKQWGALLERFGEYKQQHNKVYSGTQQEEALRFANFRASVKTVEAHNALPDQSFRMGLNQFSDMSDEEFEAKILMKPQDCSATEGRTFVSAPAASSVDLPLHVDWREKGVVSEVKDQGECGSCWTFSTVGALEAHLALKYDNWRAPRLSEQQLVDCAQAFDNHGCNGGLPSHAFQYVHSAGGLSTEFSYPYKGKDGKCLFHRPATPGATSFQPSSTGVGVTVPGGAVNLTQGDEAALKYFLATRGPVSVAYQVAADFRHYASGIYSSKVCKSGSMDVNHAVLAVGYGKEPTTGMEYWTIKNSWDYSFGMEGFFKIEAMRNMCGIAQCNSFPDLYGINAGMAAAKTGEVVV